MLVWAFPNCAHAPLFCGTLLEQKSQCSTWKSPAFQDFLFRSNRAE